MKWNLKYIEQNGILIVFLLLKFFESAMTKIEHSRVHRVRMITCSSAHGSRLWSCCCRHRHERNQLPWGRNPITSQHLIHMIIRRQPTTRISINIWRTRTIDIWLLGVAINNGIMILIIADLNLIMIMITNVITVDNDLIIVDVWWWRSGRSWRRRSDLVLPRGPTHWNISQRSTCCPISSTRFAKVSWLREAVIVVITELCVVWIASWTLQNLIFPCLCWFSFPNSSFTLLIFLFHAAFNHNLHVPYWVCWNHSLLVLIQTNKEI